MLARTKPVKCRAATVGYNLDALSIETAGPAEVRGESA
jgi:hypothetical protein